MPIFKFDKALHVVRGVKNFLNVEGGASRDASPDVEERHENRRSYRQRNYALKKELQTKRNELSQITDDIRIARREAGGEEPLEQVKRAKRKQREIFQVQIKLRAVKEGAEETLTTGTLPDFAIIGAAKCGTTFIPPSDQTPSRRARRDQGDTLLRHAPRRGHRVVPQMLPEAPVEGRMTITGEASLSYLFDPRVPERMAEVVPRARLMAVLRNPVDRTLSAYYHRLRNGQETRTFEESVRASLEGDPDSNRLSRNIYVDYLQRWSTFFSEEYMLVVKSEDLFERPRASLKTVFDFLDLPDWEPAASDLGDRLNRGGYEQEMDPATRESLQDFFEPHNQRPYDFLGVDSGW